MGLDTGRLGSLRLKHTHDACMQIYELRIGDSFRVADILITVLNVEDEQVRLQIDAPPQVPIAVDGAEMENEVH